MLELRELKASEESQWDQVADSSLTGTLFHLSQWLSLLEQTQETRLYKYGVFDGSDLIGILPLFIKTFGLLRVAGSPVIAEDTPYMGPVIPMNYLPEVLRCLSLELRRLRVHFVRIILPPSWPRPEVECLGYEVHAKTAHMVDLNLGPNELFANFEKSCRKKIRKAERFGVQVCWTRHVEDWESHYELLTELCRRQQRLPPNKREFYEGLREHFQASERIALVVCRYEEKVIAAQIYGLYKDTVYCLNEASHPDFRNVAPNDAKHWEGMKSFMKKGYRFYDLGNADTPNLARYKRNFGGREINFFVLERSSSWVVSWLRQHYTAYRYLKMRIATMLSHTAKVHNFQSSPRYN